MADHNKPTSTSTYANFVTELDARLDDLALGLDPALVTVTNQPTNTIRWTSASNKWQKWNGTAWGDLTTGYAIPIVGGSVNNSPIGATTASTGKFTTLETTTAGTAAVPSVKVGASDGGLFKTTGNGVGLTSAGVKVAEFNTGYSAIGSGAAANNVHCYNYGTLTSPGAGVIGYGFYNRVTFPASAANPVFVNTQYSNTLLDDAVARAITYCHERLARPTVTGLTAGSTVDYSGSIQDDLTDLAVTVGRYLVGAINERAGTTRHNLYMSGSAPNYLAGSLGIGTTAPKTKLEISGTTSQSMTMPLSTISGFTLTVPSASTLTGTPVVGDRIWGPNIAAGTRIKTIDSVWAAGVTDGVYTLTISQTVTPRDIYGSVEATNAFRITDTDTSANEGQHVGSIEFYASDSSAPGAGIRGFIEVVAENTTPDHAMVFGVLDDDDALATAAREVGRFHSGGQLQLKKNAVATSFSAEQHAALIDIRLATYDSKSKSIAAEEITPASVLFSRDGLRMFVIGSAGDDINYYTLTTAWDVTTATFNSLKSFSAQELVPGSAWFKPDGKTFYVLGITSMTVFQYSLSTAWDISTMTYDSKSFTVSVVGETVTYGIPFTPDGLSFFVSGQTTDMIYRYNMGTAWDVTTAVYHSAFGIVDRETAARGIFFSADGLNFFVVGTTGDDVTQWRLHSAYDLSSAVYVGEFSVNQGGTEPFPTGIFFSPDCNKFYVVGQTLDTVHQYSLPLRKTQFLGTSSANVIETTKYIKRPIPVTKAADFVVGEAESWLINAKAGSACSATLPDPATYSGRELTIKTVVAFGVNSASSNVIPLAGGAAQSVIVTGTAGKWATLVSNGVAWEVMAGA